MSKPKIEEFFAIDDIVKWYKRCKPAAVALVKSAGIPTGFIDGDEASRLDALELACAIIALAG